MSHVVTVTCGKGVWDQTAVEEALKILGWPVTSWIGKDIQVAGERRLRSGLVIQLPGWRYPWVLGEEEGERRNYHEVFPWHGDKPNLTKLQELQAFQDAYNKVMHGRDQAVAQTIRQVAQRRGERCRTISEDQDAIVLEVTTE